MMRPACTRHSRGNKILLIGGHMAGTTSIKCTIFDNYLPKDTSRLGPTIKISYSEVNLFNGNLQLDLWDTSAADKFMESYFTSQQDIVFNNIQIVIFVFDISQLMRPNARNYYAEYQSTLNCLKKHSPNAQTYCLIHKMDVIDLQNRNNIFNKYKKDIIKNTNSFGLNIKYFATSIWNESLSQCWSHILRSFIFKTMNDSLFTNKLRNLCKKSHLDEIALFESSTNLLIAHSINNKISNDKCRFDKIGNMLNYLKRKIRKRSGYLFNSMMVSNSKFTAHFRNYTQNLSILFVFSNPLIEIDAVIINLNAVKHQFEEDMLWLFLNGITKDVLYIIIKYWFRTIITQRCIEVCLINIVAAFYPSNIITQLSND